jgi:hypothetical protein
MLTQLEESYYEREIQKVYMKPTKVPFTLDRIWREDEMQAHLKLDYWSLHLHTILLLRTDRAWANWEILL